MYRCRLARALAALALLPIGVLAWLWLMLPDVDTLHSRARAPSTRILDRDGRLLYEIIDPRAQDGGRHRALPLDRIPPYLRQATIAVEDANFYSNPGVDAAGVLRALWINLRGGEVLAGGSTITQQLARMLLLDPEERAQRTLLRKARESLLALRITRLYTKDEVLALYLNESYYGNLAYGVEAAAQSYFGRGAAELNLAECALLAGLPQSPAAYDPFFDLPRARARQAVVLDLMLKSGAISASDAAQARAAPIRLAPAPYAIRAPHFVTYVRRWLETQFGPERMARGGLIVTTTLDLTLNDAATGIVRAHLGELAQARGGEPAHDAHNAAVVALDPRSGEIRVMVGSPAYFDAANAGAVNGALALRQPGSAIKPVTYAAALAGAPGFTAATPLFDVRTAFPTKEGLPYVPVNYDQRNHGVISARAALATSNNVAAVSVLQRVGLRPMLDLANALGLRSLADPDRFGLALTLGGGEIRLLDLTSAFGVFANAGAHVSPKAVQSVADAQGIVWQADGVRAQVLDPRVAWLISDILADNTARAPAFGESSVLRMARPAAVKTGTTTDFRDNWTIGYTPQLAIGVWLGNADGAPMQAISGVSGAGPIWRDVMDLAHRGLSVQQFERPPGLRQVTVCALSGMLPSPACGERRSEWFIDGTEPRQADTWHRLEQGRLALDLPAEVRDWARAQGWPLAGARPAGRMAAAHLSLIRPDDGTRFRLDPALPAGVQRAPLSVQTDLPDVARIEIVLDGAGVIARLGPGARNAFWPLQPGAHTLQARAILADGRRVESALVRVVVEH